MPRDPRSGTAEVANVTPGWSGAGADVTAKRRNSAHGRVPPDRAVAGAILGAGSSSAGARQQESRPGVTGRRPVGASRARSPASSSPSLGGRSATHSGHRNATIPLVEHRGAIRRTLSIAIFGYSDRVFDLLFSPAFEDPAARVSGRVRGERTRASNGILGGGPTLGKMSVTSKNVRPAAAGRLASVT